MVSTKRNRTRVSLSLLIYAFSIALYLQPITNDFRLVDNPTPILDEIHLMPDTNLDVRVGEEVTPISVVFTNDYWGRPMDSPSSHKSFRPLTILSFRSGNFLSKKLGWDYLFVQRLVNVIIHAAITQMVGRLSTCIFDKEVRGLHVAEIERIVTMLLFMLHPTHVETVVNAANRAHLLSLLFTVSSLDLSLKTFSVGMINIASMLSCETAIFYLPAMILSWVYLDFTKRRGSRGRGGSTLEKEVLQETMLKLLPRIGFVSFTTFVYLLMRYFLKWISIPDGLIRPAENPFYELKGKVRVMSYSYVLSVHLIKSLGLGLVDLVGFSHEYGFDCVEKISEWRDGRLMFPLVLFCLGISQMNKMRKLESYLIVFTFLAWMATLFPVSGLMKVGTFIADRIVIGSTVVSSILWGRMIAIFLQDNHYAGMNNTLPGKLYLIRPLFIKIVKYSIILLNLSFLWIKVQTRSSEWMYFDSLLESSLRSCPRSAKSHLEISKLYSGLVGSLHISPTTQHRGFDLNVAKYHLETAESIDPLYCDVHFQFSQLSVLEKSHDLEFEDRLTKGVLCPTTMNGAHNLFQQYWSQIVIRGAAERSRYQNHLKVIQNAIHEENKEVHTSGTGNSSNHEEL